MPAYNEPSPLADLIAKLSQMREPKLGHSPHSVTWRNRLDHQRAVATAIAEWACGEVFVTLNTSRADKHHRLSDAALSDCAMSEIMESFADHVSAHVDAAIEVAEEMEAHPDAYTAIAAE